MPMNVVRVVQSPGWYEHVDDFELSGVLWTPNVKFLTKMKPLFGQDNVTDVFSWFVRRCWWLLLIVQPLTVSLSLSCMCHWRRNRRKLILNKLTIMIINSICRFQSSKEKEKVDFVWTSVLAWKYGNMMIVHLRKIAIAHEKLVQVRVLLCVLNIHLKFDLFYVL